MLAETSDHFAWLCTVNRLYGLDVQPYGAIRQEEKQRRERIAEEVELQATKCVWAATVRIIGRPSPRTALIEWCDATKCRYGSQLWKACRSRTAGACSLTGAVIKIGDAIYKPRYRYHKPLNLSAMIRAEYVERIDCDEVV